MIVLHMLIKLVEHQECMPIDAASRLARLPIDLKERKLELLDEV